MVLGEAVRGGRVIADWPGLGTGALLEERDLRPTASLDGLILSVLGGTFGIDPDRMKDTLFPGGHVSAPFRGLVRI